MTIGLVQVAVLTRYLGPADFGELAVLAVSATALTLIYNAGTLQGTFSWVYGTAADEEAGDDDARVGSSDRRRGLATGLAMTCVAAALGTAGVVVFARPLAELLLGGAQDAYLMGWAACGAGAASVWRLAVNTLRLQRRPGAYFTASTAHGALGLLGVVVLLEAGRGLEGAVVGVAIGNILATLLTTSMIRRDVRLAVSWHDAKNIMRRGRALIPVIAAFYTIQLADILLLSRFLPSSEVGLYRVAARIGALVSYWTTSFHMAWGPMRRDPLHVAADRDRGAPQVAAALATYFTLLTLGAILACAIFADELVQIASPSYKSSAAFIPLTAAGFGFHGWYVLVYRTADFPRKRTWFVWLSVLVAATFVGSAFALVPWLGTYGISLAVMTGWTVGITGMCLRGQWGARSVPFEYGRILKGLLTAVGCYACARVLEGDSPLAALLIHAGCLAAFPVLLVALGILPRGATSAAAGVVRVRLTRVRASRPAAVLSRVAELDEDEQTICQLLLGERLPAADAAARLKIEEELLLARLVVALRTVAALGATPAASDPVLGRFLLMDGSFADREERAVTAFAHGVDPEETDVLARTAATLRRLPPQAWRVRAVANRSLSGR